MAEKWIRSGVMPDVQKITFVVDARHTPELAEFIWNLPRGKTSECIRSMLAKYIELGAGRSIDMPTKSEPQTVKHLPPLEQSHRVSPTVEVPEGKESGKSSMLTEDQLRAMQQLGDING